MKNAETRIAATSSVVDNADGEDGISAPITVEMKGIEEPVTLFEIT